MFSSLAIAIPAFLIALTILIAVHEYGHFQVARWCGVKVLRFSIGFGKAFYSKRFGADQTEFVLAAIPLGGYVKMLDEREEPVVNSAELPRAFNRQSVWKRILIVSAGPLANLLLAIFLYWILLIHGVTGIKPILGELVKGKPAAVAGLQSGQIIMRIDNHPVATWQDVHWAMLKAVVSKKQVEIEAANEKGAHYLYHLDISSISKDDLEADFLQKLGLAHAKPNLPPVIGKIMPGSAAEKAGMEASDKVLSVDGKLINTWDEMVDIIRGHAGKSLGITIQRGKQTLTLQVTPDTAQESGQAIGRIGAVYEVPKAEFQRLLTTVSYSPLEAISQALSRTWDTSLFSLKMLGKMILGEVSWKSVSGPVTIASFAGQSASMGLESYIGFLALISISLGVLNLLPIPVLDGGHLLYYMAEILKGSPVSEQTMEIGQRLGLSLLGGLMVVAFYNDINRLFAG